MTSSTKSRLDPEERRQQITRCARALFTAHGYDGVSIADIADSAGVTSALVHHYFGGKRELYLSVVRAVVETARDVSMSVVDSTRPLETRVSATIDAWLSYVEREGDAWLAVTAHGNARNDPEVAALISDARETCAQRMLRAYAGSVPETPATLFVMRSFIDFNEAVSRRWQAGEATRSQVHKLLTLTLLQVITEIGQAVEDVADSRAEASSNGHDPSGPALAPVPATADD